ncbi:hypothetical protein CEXT_621291 [Caerostris extrusa]|uniref:Uncharacterized protein n=1 Tax=Caerostris extrusa TaxID=172846 RepID=A0AAV4SAB1_CAEEX|nr:hypothetical protein CEXT_621291 [Caerostris extrusa]
MEQHLILLPKNWTIKELCSQNQTLGTIICFSLPLQKYCQKQRKHFSHALKFLASASEAAHDGLAKQKTTFMRNAKLLIVESIHRYKQRSSFLLVRMPPFPI